MIDIYSFHKDVPSSEYLAEVHIVEGEAGSSEVEQLWSVGDVQA